MNSYSVEITENMELKDVYEEHCKEPSDINEHLPVLCSLAKECATVVEIGLRGMVSSWGILEGLAENTATTRSYIGIDLYTPPDRILNAAKKLSNTHGISFRFWQANDLYITIPPADMLFIDSLHTYIHLTYELEKFSPFISKYIAMHDTSEPWGNVEDDYYQGDYSEYPGFWDRKKKGLWPAVKDFLERHPEWVLYERRFNNHGFTILKRISEE